MDHVIDTETLSLSTEAVIVNVGIVSFDPGSVDSFQDLVNRGTLIYLSRAQQLALGREQTKDVLDWWAEQGEEAARQLEVEGLPLECVIPEMQKHTSIYGNKNSRWYCRGTHFDIAKLEHLFWQIGEITPWHYRKPRCSRTLLDEWGVSDDMWPVRPTGMIPHNAMHDAAFEAYLIQRVRNGVPLDFVKN